MRTETYQAIGDYLAHTHFGIAEDVTPEELAALKDGSLAHATIALRYLAEIETKGIRLETNPLETRRDLLEWISSEIDASRWDDQWAADDEAMFARLDALRAFAARKKVVEARMQTTLVEMLAKAYSTGPSKPSKGALAEAAMISRPTLDAWLQAAAEAPTEAGS